MCRLAMLLREDNSAAQAHLSYELEAQQQAHDADHHADVEQVCTAITGSQESTDPSQPQQPSKHLE